MKRLLTLLFIGLISQAYSQQQISTSTIIVHESRSSEWETYVDETTFSIEYRFVDCDPEMGYDQEMIILRVTNKSEDLISVGWFLQTYYSKDECRTCDYKDEYYFTLNLNPGEILEGDCSIYSESKLKLFSQFNDKNYKKGEQLYSFSLANLNSKSVQID